MSSLKTLAEMLSKNDSLLSPLERLNNFNHLTLLAQGLGDVMELSTQTDKATAYRSSLLQIATVALKAAELSDRENAPNTANGYDFATAVRLCIANCEVVMYRKAWKGKTFVFFQQNAIQLNIPNGIKGFAKEGQRQALFDENDTQGLFFERKENAVLAVWMPTISDLTALDWQFTECA